MILIVIVNLASRGGFRHEPTLGETIGHDGLISGPDGGGDRRQEGPQHQPPTARLQLRHLPNPQPVTALQAASLLFLGGLAAFAGAGVGV